MGLGIAIGGSIAALTIFVIILTYPMVSENLVETTNARSEILEINNKLQKTGLDIPVLHATNDESIINFTISNFGMEKLWNYEDFTVIVTYDANVGGISTPTVEQINFEENSSFLGSQLVINVFERPDSDIQQGGWDDNCGGCINNEDFFEEIDESTRDDSDYLESSNLNVLGETDLIEFGLSDVNDPQTSSGHIVRYTYSKDAAGGIEVDFTVRLLQGVTEIASWTHSNVSDVFTLATQTLSASEADSITDYTDLRLEFTAEYAAGIAPFRSGQISWAEFEVPSNVYTTIEVNCNTSTDFNSGDWIISNVTDDSFDPRIINQNEVAHICLQLSNPVFTNGDVSLNIATDIGHTASQSTTGS